MAAILKHLQEAPRPLAKTRLMYVSHMSYPGFEEMINEMMQFKLIKAVPSDRIRRGPRKYGEMGTNDSVAAHYMVITAKGTQLLKLLDEIAKLTPSAPWVIGKGEY